MSTIVVLSGFAFSVRKPWSLAQAAGSASLGEAECGAEGAQSWFQFRRTQSSQMLEEHLVLERMNS